MNIWSRDFTCGRRGAAFGHCLGMNIWLTGNDIKSLCSPPFHVVLGVYVIRTKCWQAEQTSASERPKQSWQKRVSTEQQFPGFTDSKLAKLKILTTLKPSQSGIIKIKESVQRPPRAMGNRVTVPVPGQYPRVASNSLWMEVDLNSVFHLPSVG